MMKASSFRMYSLCWIMFLFFFSNLTCFATASSMPQVTSLDTPYHYSAKTISDQLIKLNQLYPDWTYLSVIGYSHDKKPIYSLVMTENAQFYRENPHMIHTTRKHYLFEAGLHGREVVNPVVMLAIIEMYLQAVDDPKALPYVPIEILLQSNVLHFIPLSNPDGFDLSKGGLDTLTQPSVKSATAKLNLKFFNQLKSNARGVDLNRNFPDVYFDPKAGSWIDIWLKKVNQYVSSKPSLAFFQGATPACEPETKCLMAYINRFNFQATVSFHSKGEVIYWRFWMHGDAYNQANYSLAKRIANYTGYKLTSGDPLGASSGYMTDYIANTLQKPAITVETMDADDLYHSASSELYKRVLTELRYVPYATVVWGQEQALGKYHLYQDHYYVRDYQEEAIADAHAAKFGGTVRFNSQDPVFLVDTAPSPSAITATDPIDPKDALDVPITLQEALE